MIEHEPTLIEFLFAVTASVLLGICARSVTIRAVIAFVRDVSMLAMTIAGTVEASRLFVRFLSNS